MNKSLAIILLLFFIPTNQTIPSDAISYSFPEYRFYIDKPTTISYPEMKFSIIGGAIPSNISCWYTPVEGLNITITLEWYDREFAPNERVENQYAIHVGETFAITTPIQISCAEKTEGGNLALGGSITNWITYYSENSGSFLNLRIVDQSGRGRNSTVRLLHRIDNTVPWTPIKAFNGSVLNILLPNGFYQVLANDLDSDISNQQIFQLDSDMSVDVVLSLVGFSTFKLLNSRGILEIEMLINNYVDTLLNVSIYGELYFEDELFQTTNLVRFSEFAKTEDFMLTIGFPVFNWKNGNYTVKGFIDAGDFNIAEKEVGFSYFDEKKEKNGISLLIVMLIVAIIIISIPTIIFIRKRYQDELEVNAYTLENCKHCDAENMAPFIYCSNCGKEQ